MLFEGNLRVSYGQFTSPGLKPENEDCLGIRIPGDDTLTTKGLALVIADGVSSAGGGKEAGELCVLGFLSDYYSTPNPWLVKTSAHCVLASLNAWLHAKGRCFIDEQKDFLSAMSAMVIRRRTVHVFHVGDTRVYRLRDGVFEQLTNDHSTWGATKKRRLLTRAMGLDLNLDVDYWHEEAQEDDIYLLTTDGVHDHVSHRELAQMLMANGEDFDRACHHLVEYAMQRESKDNLSAQILRIDALPTATRGEFFEALGDLPFPPELGVGRQLDGYEVLGLLEANTGGRLYHVRDRATGRELVMKTPARISAGDPAYVERFITEEWIGTRVNDEHLVQVLVKRRRPNYLYYLMERVEGQNVEEWIRANPEPDVSQVVDLVEQISLGLLAMHRREALHQNLKPANIVIEPGGRVKIVDLGSVFIAGINEIFAPIGLESTPDWRCHSAPECRLGRRPSAKSDLFSLAVITYGMLTGGRHPFGENYHAARTAGEFGRLTYAPAAEFNPQIAHWFDSALKKALALDPDRRHEALTEFVVDLRRANPDFVDPADLPLLERNPVLFWQVLAGSVVVVGLLAWLLK